MVTYVVNYTDSAEVPISIDELEVNRNLPMALFGRRRLEYGEEMNENILHLLENFACPELMVGGIGQGVPDLGVAVDNTLGNAIDGQLWFNSTQDVLYQRTGGVWIPLGHLGEVASNFGTMLGDGSQLPLPVSDSGYAFTYDECSWLVSPRNYTDVMSEMVCTTDSEARVTHTYTTGSGVVTGTVNYMIIGIRNALQQAPNISATPLPSMTATPIPPSATPQPTPPATPLPSAGTIHPEIMWAGPPIVNNLSSANYVGNLITFRGDSGTGPSGQANFEYWNGTTLFEGWANRTPIYDGEFWIKFEKVGDTNLANANLSIMDKFNNSYGFTNLGATMTDAFDANYAQLIITNSSLTTGQSSSIDLIVHICGDVGGVPDEAWASREVNLSVERL